MLDFIEVDKNDKSHKEATFKIINEREYNISHINKINYSEHIKFIENHPYRNWYLIKNLSDFIGTLYLTKDNVVGINFIKSDINFFQITLDFFLNNHEPLPPIKSIRSDSFLININPNNKKLSYLLEKNNAIHIQNTYKLRK